MLRNHARRLSELWDFVFISGETRVSIRCFGKSDPHCSHLGARCKGDCKMHHLLPDKSYTNEILSGSSVELKRNAILYSDLCCPVA